MTPFIGSSYVLLFTLIIFRPFYRQHNKRYNTKDDFNMTGPAENIVVE